MPPLRPFRWASGPAGFTAHGLPIGMQLQADYFEEARLLEIAHRFQQATDWHRREPPAALAAALRTTAAAEH